MINSIVSTHPEVAREAKGWNPALVSKGTEQVKDWICPIGHIYQAAVCNRTKGKGCPYCSHNKVLRGFNDLQTTHPNVARQAYGWDPTNVIAGSGAARLFDGVTHPAGEPVWASCYLNAEMIIRVAGEAVLAQKMGGESADMPERRAFTADLLHATADLVRDLALDADWDATLTDEQWHKRLGSIRGLLSGMAYPPEGVSGNRSQVTVIAKGALLE